MSGIDPAHTANARIAKSLYLDSQSRQEAAADWLFAVRDARRDVAATLRASNFLTDISGALVESGRHALIFRQMLAPPLSQDQFKLLCPSYAKSTENNGNPFKPAIASGIADFVFARLDLGIAGWASRKERPNRRELETCLRVVSTLIGLQRLSTARRNRLALEQESALTRRLLANHWTRLPSRLIDTRAAVPARHFMHKTRFATATTTPQEVDIACGLGNTGELCKSPGPMIQ